MKNTLSFDYIVPGDDFTRAGEASSDVKHKLKQIGYDSDAIRRVAIAMYEGEINMVIHAGGGQVHVEINPEKVDMVLADQGPGIKDIALAMREGYSTAPDNVRALGFGAGMGLSNMLYGANAFGVRAEAPKDATVVVLGSKVSGTTPSADLRARIDAAAVYLKANPQAKCVVSGGQGAGELVTEASAMEKGLVLQGIDASRILTEDRSTTTVENLKNSLAVIKQNGLSSDLAIVTDEYHEFRAGKIAENLGAKSYAVCAQTPWYIFSACYARELLALTNFLVIA